MKGMWNRKLIISLDKSESNYAEIDENIVQNYLGGRGLALKLFVDSVPPNLEPLSAQNELVFATGPLTGTVVPTSGRFAMVTKSPLTGTIFNSNTGGFIGYNMKRCGIDALVVKGKSEKPVYAVIDGESTVEIKDATELWGMDTKQTMAKLKTIEGDKINALMIGPAGENQVLFACIMNDGDHRAFGRGGVGAVMGSKNLKAIVVKNGKKKTEMVDGEKVKRQLKPALDKIKLVPITRASLPMFGTSSLVNLINEMGMLPIRNFQKGYHEDADKISGEKIRSDILTGDEGCYACPIRCGRMTKAGDMEGKGPEYESVALLGASTEIFNLEIVTQANYYCNLLGLDTVTTGSTIACAMELQENGMLSDSEIAFGNEKVLIPLIKKIAAKEGIGAELALGSKRLAEKYSQPDSAIHVKGLELPAYDPRGAFGHALGYATSNRGGCHLVGYLAAMEIFAAPKKVDRHTTAGKSDLLVLKQHQSAVEDSLIVCKFAGWALDMDFYARFASAVTGTDLNVSELLHIGERIYNLERLYNIREGIGGDQDTLPKRFTEVDLDDGLRKNPKVPLDFMLQQYYNVRKWDKQGVPSEKILNKVGLKPLKENE